MQFTSTKHFFGLSASTIKVEFRLWLEQKMRNEWEIKINMVHSKIIMPMVDKKRIKKFIPSSFQERCKVDYTVCY